MPFFRYRLLKLREYIFRYPFLIHVRRTIRWAYSIFARMLMYLSVYLSVPLYLSEQKAIENWNSIYTLAMTVFSKKWPRGHLTSKYCRVTLIALSCLFLFYHLNFASSCFLFYHLNFIYTFLKFFTVHFNGFFIYFFNLS